MKEKEKGTEKRWGDSNHIHKQIIISIHLDVGNGNVMRFSLLSDWFSSIGHAQQGMPQFLLSPPVNCSWNFHFKRRVKFRSFQILWRWLTAVIIDEMKGDRRPWKLEAVG